MATPMPYDAAVGDDICEQLMEGKSLRAICAAENMPSRPTVFKWLLSSPEFVDQYTRAREAQADTLFDETLDIADDATNDWEERKHFAGADASPQVNGDVIARAKLRIDTRKWMAGKLRPKKYGEKLDIDQTTTLDVADPVKALLETIATSGKRLGSSTNVSSGEDPLLARKNDFASDGEN